MRCTVDPCIVELAEDLKAISDPNRLRIICLLSQGERCACEVDGALGISQQLASHHLNVLKDKGLLNVRREGTSSYYSVNRDRLKQVNDIFSEYLDYRKVKTGTRSKVKC
jgi:ArsR family transcriptional regulator